MGAIIGIAVILSFCICGVGIFAILGFLAAKSV